MTSAASVIATAVATVAAVPATVHAVQCLLGSLPWQPRPLPVPPRPVRLAVLVPAHDEAAGIGATVRDLLPQLAAGDRLVVIADNCTDDTAIVARGAAAAATTPATALVVERRDADRRGKGHALAFGRRCLLDDPPDVVVIVDADCRVAAGNVRDLATWAVTCGCPVQADYLLASPGDSLLANVGAFAILVRNRVRPRGLARLGLPVQITGSGFALPWTLSAWLDQLGGNIVEDLVLGLEAARTGHPTRACPEVRVVSELPSRDADLAKQRRRWEHGQMATALGLAPRLLATGLMRLRPALVALALDLLVPPLALLVLLLVLLLAMTGLLAIVGSSDLPFRIAIGAALAVGCGTGAAWAVHGRGVLPFAQLLRVPFYVAWKIPLYLGFLRRREQAWHRTRRDGEAPR